MRPCTATPDPEKEAFSPSPKPERSGIYQSRQAEAAARVGDGSVVRAELDRRYSASFGRGIGAGASSRRRHAAMGDP